MKLSAIVAAAFIGLVSAQAAPPIISVTSPLIGTSYKAGSQAIITWINPTVETISAIVLAKGSSTALQPVSQIAQNVDAKAGTYTWNIPADITPGSDYAFEFGTSPNIAFTGHFSITGGSGSSNTTTPSSGSGSSSAASTPSSGSGSSGSSSSSGSAAKGSSSTTSSGSASSPKSTSNANALAGTAMAMGAAAVVAAAQLL
ncbi:unnamed protein product [Cunninghamella blakesleeana]